MCQPLTALVVITALCSSVVSAGDAIHRVQIDGLDIVCFAPGNIPVYRGVLLDPAANQPGPLSVKGETARNLGFIQVGMGRDTKSKGSAQAAALPKALAEFAKLTGHPELLQKLPYLFTGLSAGGGQAVRLGSLLPDQTIAVTSVCAWHARPTDTGSHNIPMIFAVGETDVFKQLPSIEDAFVPSRKLHALHGTAIMWKTGHDFGNANSYALPFFESMTATRLPATWKPGDALALKPIKEEEGWLGDRATWASTYATIAPWNDYKGDKSIAVWLPNRKLAMIWRAWVAKNSPISIEAACVDGSRKLPPPLKRVEVAPNAVDIIITATVTGTAPAKVVFYDGDTVISESASAPYTATLSKPAAGCHALYAVAVDAAGQEAVSNPGMFVVCQPGVAVPAAGGAASSTGAAAP